MDNIFNLQKFCDFASRRKESAKKSNNNYLAAAFKARRLQLNKTLDRATDGKCSKAYASKFENNQIDIDDDIGRMLYENVDLDYDRIKSLDQQNILASGIRMFLFNQNDQICGLIESMNYDFFIAQNKIIELLVSLIDGHFERSEELIYEIDRVRGSLTEYEFIAFGICICEYYLKTNQLLKAKKFIVGFTCDIHFKELKFLYLEQRFNVYFNLGEKSPSFNAYKELEKEFNSGYPRKREFLDKLHFLELFASIDTLKELKDMLDDMIPDDYIEEYWYTYCLCLIKNENYKECMELIQKYELNNSKFVALYVYCANMVARMIPSLKGKDTLSKRLSPKTITYVNSFVERMEKNHQNIIDRNFIKLMQLEMVGTSNEELASYIREVALKYDATYQHRFYSSIYAHRLFELLGNMTRYKEAYMIAKNDRTFK